MPIKSNVLRSLYLLSGNRCAFPKCTQVLIDDAGDFVGEVCHIEAAEPGGQRHNLDITNEERRAGSNLILLCRNHHKKTDNVKKFTVEVLRQMKEKHEFRFLDVEDKIAASLADSTESEQPSEADNLKRMNKVLGWDRSHEELVELVVDIRKHVEVLRNVPARTREFLAKVSKRIYKMRKKSVVDNDGGNCRIGTHDIENAFGLSSSELLRKGEELEQYGLGGIDEHESYGPLKHVVIVYAVNYWPLWNDIAAFCEKTDMDIATFWRDLDFSVLDE